VGGNIEYLLRQLTHIVNGEAVHPNQVT